MNNNYYSGSPQGGTPRTQKKDVFNQWQAIGILRSRSTDENEPLKFIPWKNGGGVVNANLKITEQIGVDENGQPKTRKTSVPVSIKTNKNITAQQLQSIMSGTKVRVVGRIQLETYESKSTNSRKTTLVADVYVLEILEVPMQPAFGGYPQGMVPPQGMTPPQGMPAPGYPPQGYPQAQPQYHPGQQPPQQYYHQPQQAPQPQQMPTQMPPQQQYYQQPHQPQQAPQMQGQQVPAWYQHVPQPVIDDLPE